MTFKYEITDEGMNIIDHNGTVVKTIQNDGSGYTIPDDVSSVMREQARTARDNGNMERWRDIHIRLADDDIELKE